MKLVFFLFLWWYSVSPVSLSANCWLSCVCRWNCSFTPVSLFLSCKRYLIHEWLGPNHFPKAYQMPTTSPHNGRGTMVKPKWNRGFTRIKLNANGLQASESVKLVFMAFLLWKLNYLNYKDTRTVKQCKNNGAFLFFLPIYL